MIELPIVFEEVFNLICPKDSFIHVGFCNFSLGFYFEISGNKHETRSLVPIKIQDHYIAF